MTKRYVTERFKTKEDWLNARGIGGTDVAAIVGLSPWKDKLELYNRLVNGSEKQVHDSTFMARGRNMEPLIRKLWAATHPDMKMRPPRGFEMYRSKDIPLLTATLDGTVIDKNGRKGVWECKTHEVRNSEDLAEWTGRWPTHYLIQTFNYLLVRNDCDFIELCGALDFYDYTGEERRLKKTEVRYEHIERSDIALQLEWLKEEVLKFCKCVETRTPPDGEIKF